MRHQIKRSVSLMLVLVMFVSLLSGLTIHVHAASYSYNTGTRGRAATALSAAAISFYADNLTSYETLSSLDGSSVLDSVPDSDLYDALQSLMASNHTHMTTYSETTDLYVHTDCQNADSSSISSFYSGVAIGPEWDHGGTWNREHTWPKSKSPDGANEDDIIMLRPTAMSENSTRGNRAYGVSSGYYHPNSENDGSYDVRGDVARIMLYTYTRWGGQHTSYMWGSSGVIESKTVLLDWIKADPVDTWELSRNDVVQQITGTRNIFVDYPELAYVLFDEPIPSNMTTPSGNAGKTHAITVTVNDSTMGTVSVSGNNINAIPAEGYIVIGYTLLSGTATITQNGNAFIVNATSDCAIQINFGPRSEVTLTFKDNGNLVSSTTVYSGDAVTLPAYTGTAPADYTFVGWSDAVISHSEQVPSYYKAGASYTVTDDTTMHALFSYVADTGENTGIWTLVTNASLLSAGSQIVLAENSKGVIAGNLSGSYLGKVDATFSADKNTIPALPDNALILTLGGSAGAWTLENPAGKLLGATAIKKLTFYGGSTKWTISVSESAATIQNTTSSYGRFLYNAGAPRFTTYTSNSNASMLLPQIYMLNSGRTTFYTTESCKHEHAEHVAAQPATCTAEGYTAGVYCHDCDSYISGHQKIPATGHDYQSVVTPPTVTDPGYTTYTCANCGDTYVGDEVPALGQTYTVTFSVPAGVTPIDPMGCNTTGITLPVADAPQSDYAFLGWTAQPVDHSQTEPDYYEGGSTYVATADIILYALYSYVKGGTGEISYRLVNNIDQLRIGSHVVIATVDYDLALSTTQNENNRSPVTITKNPDNTITFGSDAAVLILGEGTVAGTWSLYCAANNGFLYAASNSGNHLKTKAALDANGSFSISVSNTGSATVVAQGDKANNRLRYNSTNKIFSCYGSGHKDICFYIETQDGERFFTTDTAHVHIGVYQEAVPATCTSAGTIAHYLCACGKMFSDSTCTKELSSIVDPQKPHAYTAKAVLDSCLRTKADCKNSATYYLSCISCGASSKGTEAEDFFYSGDPDPDNHIGETYLSGAADPTCTTPGHTGDTCCTGCHTVLISGEMIPASHKLIFVPKVAATHDSDGTAAHYECSACGKLFLDDQGAQEVDARDLVIEEIPHAYGDYEYNSDKHWKECSCGSKTSEGKHTFGKWTVVKAATTSSTGTRERSCTVCGYTQRKTIPATSSPSTGDLSHPTFHLFLMLASGFGLVMLIPMGRKKGKYLR